MAKKGNMKTFLKSLLAITAALVILGGCGTTTQLPPAGSTDTHIEHRDSIIYKVDTLKIGVPYEVIKEVVPELDTLRMESSVAKATAFLDQTTRTLKGTLENKKTELKQPQVVYKEKISYRDTTIYKEIPVPYPVEKEVRYVPWIVKVLAWAGGIAIVALVLYLLAKLGIFSIKAFLKI